MTTEDIFQGWLNFFTRTALTVSPVIEVTFPWARM
jgi:hypothetical protein